LQRNVTYSGVYALIQRYNHMELLAGFPLKLQKYSAYEEKMQIWSKNDGINFETDFAIPMDVAFCALTFCTLCINLKLLQILEMDYISAS